MTAPAIVGAGRSSQLAAVSATYCISVDVVELAGGPTSFILRTRELRSVEVTEAGWQLGRY